METVSNYPQQLKEYLKNAISSGYERYCIEYEQNVITRNRKLTREKVIDIILSMQGGSLNKELYEQNIGVTSSAFIQLRDKLSWFAFENVFDDFNALCNDSKKFKEYRVIAVDGTTVNIARNPKAESYMKYDASAKGFNQLHVNPLYDVLNRTYLHCVIQPQPKQDEVGALLWMLEWNDFEEKTLIVADRGYESYNVFAHLLEKQNTDFLIRVKQDKTAMREIRKLPKEELDVNVSFTITTTQTNYDKENGFIFIQTQKSKEKKYSTNTRAGRWDFKSPYPMEFRVVRFKLDTGEYETLATSLPRTITLEEIKELYHSRWGIETAFRELKYSIGLVNLHGKKDEFVKQEIYAAMTMANFCNRIVNEIIIQKKEANKHIYKINMKMAILLCRKFFRTPNANGKALIQDIEKYTEPVRLGRKDERNLKSKTFSEFVYRVFA